MQRIKLEGIYVPHITPFKKNGVIDEGALRTGVQFWMEGGLHGLVTCGSNGEAQYLSRSERKKIIEIVIDETNGKIPVIAGTGSMSTWETISFTKDARDLGVDAALVVTPFYFKLSSREMYEHYKAILEAVEISIVLYSVPKFTGFHLDVDIISRLADEYENVVGVKDSGGSIERIRETIKLVGKKISILAGSADLTLPTLEIGGTGAVIAVANIVPKMCTAMYEAFRRGDFQEAKKLQRDITFINRTIMKYGQISTIKAALKFLGLPSGYPRRPTLPLVEEERKEIESLLSPMLKPS